MLFPFSDGLDTMVKGKVSILDRNNKKYLRIDSLSVDLVVKAVHLMVKNIFKNNIILSEYIYSLFNLFLILYLLLF